MWYVIQTISGEETEIIEMIQKTVSKSLYQACIFPLCENVWKSKGINIKIEALFPGYVFIETENPEELFLNLRKIIKLSKLLRNGDSHNGYSFLNLKQEEVDFLKNIINDDKEQIVRRSSIWCEEKPNGGKSICRVEGPLAHYMKELVKVDFKNRRAFIELEFLGEKRRIRLGIRLLEDEELENSIVPYLGTNDFDHKIRKEKKENIKKEKEENIKKEKEENIKKEKIKEEKIKEESKEKEVAKE
ncbi:MAG: transcription termination/antitermination NusG family protein, partial [Lachnospiraceae bacterium]